MKRTTTEDITDVLKNVSNYVNQNIRTTLPQGYIFYEDGGVLMIERLSDGATSKIKFA